MFVISEPSYQVGLPFYRNLEAIELEYYQQEQWLDF